MKVSFPERVAAKAGTVNFVKLVLTVLASPLYAAGFVLGVLWLAVTWMISACQVGMEDARVKAARRAER